MISIWRKMLRRDGNADRSWTGGRREAVRLAARLRLSWFCMAVVCCLGAMTDGSPAQDVPPVDLQTDPSWYLKESDTSDPTKRLFRRYSAEAEIARNTFVLTCYANRKTLGSIEVVPPKSLLGRLERAVGDRTIDTEITIATPGISTRTVPFSVDKIAGWVDLPNDELGEVLELLSLPTVDISYLRGAIKYRLTNTSVASEHISRIMIGSANAESDGVSMLSTRDMLDHCERLGAK